jgi:endonuclease/exonuclease/phosphatase family metal-dependent hydrolase
MRRSFHIPGCLAGAFFILFIASIPFARADSFRIMAANLNGNTQSYQPFAIRIFQGLVPDVVAIQEFNYNNNTPADLRAFVDTAFGTNFVYFRESIGDIPNGIISRFPILEADSWPDPSVNNRGFTWARLQLSGTNELYVVSVHFLTSGSTDRATEALDLKTLIQSHFPSNAWIVVAGDLNTDSRSEAAMSTFGSFLSDNPIPTDAEVGGNSFTSINRNHPHDYVLPSFSMTNRMTASVFNSHSFSNGLVFDSRVYTPLTDVAPVLVNDSSNAQHMAVLKDFIIPNSGTNPVAPVVTAQPQSQTVAQGDTVTFTLAANGTAPLSYQWRFNGANLGGATGSSYSITNVQPSQAGAYSAVVTNSAGSAISSNATLTVNSSPVILTQPQNQTVSAGQDANFTVSASGATPLAYQWRFFSTNLPGATSPSFTRTNAQSADAGNYSVVITNSYGSVTSLNASLIVLTVSPSIVAQWNFNSAIPDTNTATGTTSPSVGVGTAALVGGVSQAFFGGSPNDVAAAGSDNSGWSTTTYPTQGTGNKTAGVRFNVSTAGRENISITWDQRCSNTGTKYVRLQYTTDGTTFLDFPNATALTAATVFESKTNSLASVTAINNNSNFAFRIMAEFESSAANTGNSNYVGAGGSYGTAGTVRYDVVTVLGTPITTTNPPPAPPVLSAPSFNPSHQFQFTLTGTTGSNYVVQGSTNISPVNWISLQTNTSPFIFIDTNTATFSRRFYRALASP